MFLPIAEIFDIDTVRSEIVVCLEKAYQNIPLNESARMLNFTKHTAIKEYGVKVLRYFALEHIKHHPTQGKIPLSHSLLKS